MASFLGKRHLLQQIPRLQTHEDRKGTTQVLHTRGIAITNAVANDPTENATHLLENATLLLENGTPLPDREEDAHAHVHARAHAKPRTRNFRLQA